MMLPIEKNRTLLEPILVNVTGTTNPWEIFVQTQKSGAEADKITETLEAKLIEETILISNPTVNMFCAAKFEHNWYRSKIIKVADECAQVQYVDFGNRELVSFSDICALPSLFLYHVPECFRIKVGNVKPLKNSSWSLKSIKVTEETLRDKLCNIVPLEKGVMQEDSLEPTTSTITFTNENGEEADFGMILVASKLALSC